MKTEDCFSTLLTESPAVREIIRQAETAAPCDVNVLLTGESGTGKNILARGIHKASNRCSGPFVAVNCLAIPETLVESELFGHEKGAFTDAHALKKGSFESANGGTLYLDEIGDMTPSAQGKILQAIEESSFRRVGGEQLVVFNARLIAATNRDLPTRIERGEFREDLFYRLKEVHLRLPPLRERREDIPLLLDHYVRYYGEIHGKPDLRISKAAMGYLSQYSWPGNIRELENVVKAAVVLCPQDVLFLEHFPFEMVLKKEALAASEEGLSLETVLKMHILRVLDHFRWNKRKTSQALHVSRPRLDRYIRKFGLSNEEKTGS